MKRYKYVHLCPVEKFMPPFVNFVDKQFGLTGHLFLANGLKDATFFNCCPNVKPFGKIKDIFYVLWSLNRANVIILHSLFSIKVVLIIWLQPWLLQRCRWVIWGGDLYMHHYLQETWWGRCWDRIRQQIISRIGGLITQVEGDVKNSRKWYGAKGKWYECFMYPSNLYRELKLCDQVAKHDVINILIGNSATESNNHKEVLYRIAEIKNPNIVVYCPLSYGNQLYAEMISDLGKSLFGGNFIALRQFMPIDKYAELLAKIDVAIFNHNRQQGMGNITTLLGMGKKVYLRKEITTWNFLQGLGITVFDANSIELTKIDEYTSIENMKMVRNYFSEDNLFTQLRGLFQ